MYKFFLYMCYSTHLRRDVSRCLRMLRRSLLSSVKRPLPFTRHTIFQHICGGGQPPIPSYSNTSVEGANPLYSHIPTHLWRGPTPYTLIFQHICGGGQPPILSYSNTSVEGANPLYSHIPTHLWRGQPPIPSYSNTSMEGANTLYSIPLLRTIKDVILCTTFIL